MAYGQFDPLAGRHGLAGGANPRDEGAHQRQRDLPQGHRELRPCGQWRQAAALRGADCRARRGCRQSRSGGFAVEKSRGDVRGAPGPRVQALMEFFDTNILVYAIDKSEPARRSVALQLVRDSMRAQAMVISTQVMLE